MQYTLKDGSVVESQPMGKCALTIGEKSPDGMLTVCDRGPDIFYSRKRYPRIICKCICGQYTLISPQSFREGTTKSCGCYSRKEAAKHCKKIGEKSYAKDYSQVFNPFYQFCENTQEKIPHQGFVWIIKCKKCGQLYKVIPSSIVSPDRPKGNNPCSCWKKSGTGSNYIENLLIQNNLQYTKEHKFIDCKSPKGNLMKFDFYVENCYLIEYDGQQHFKPVAFGGSNSYDALEKLKQQKEYDEIKNLYSLTHKIPLIRIPYTDIDKITIDDLLPKTSKYVVGE